MDATGVVAIILMAVLAMVASGIAFYLYRWRRVITAEQALFVPEELVDQFRRFRTEIESNGELVVKSSQLSQNSISHIDKRIAGIASAFSQLAEASGTWQNALDERDAQIKILKAGYDLEVFRRFIARFAKVRTAVDLFETDKLANPEILAHLGRLLDDAFDECGVEQFSPLTGGDYRTADGVDDNPKKVSTNNPQDAFKIAGVISPGFRARVGAGQSVLVPARVSIYIYEGGVE